MVKEALNFQPLERVEMEKAEKIALTNLWAWKLAHKICAKHAQNRAKVRTNDKNCTKKGKKPF